MGDVLSYKTRLCTNFIEGGACKYASRCRFAHGPADQRTQEDNVRDGLYSEQALHVFQASLRHRNPSQQLASTVGPAAVPVQCLDAFQPMMSAPFSQPTPSMTTFFAVDLASSTGQQQQQQPHQRTDAFTAVQSSTDPFDGSQSSMSVSRSVASQPSLNSGGTAPQHVHSMFMAPSMMPQQYVSYPSPSGPTMMCPMMPANQPLPAQHFIPMQQVPMPIQQQPPMFFCPPSGAVPMYSAGGVMQPMYFVQPQQVLMQPIGGFAASSPLSYP